MNSTHILLNGVEIEVIKEYKYLDFCLPMVHLNQPLTLAAQASKVLFSLMNLISSSPIKYPSPHILSHLFGTLVKPITEYACEVWSPTNAEELEVIHKQFCNFAFGLPTSTTNIAFYGDLGRVLLSIRYKLLFQNTG